MKESTIGQEIERRRKSNRTAGDFFGEFINLSTEFKHKADQGDDDVNLRIGEFYGIEAIPGCDPAKDLEKKLARKYGSKDAIRCIDHADVVTRNLEGLDRQVRIWEELKRDLESERWTAGHRRYAGVRGSRTALKELVSHLNSGDHAGDNPLNIGNIQLVSGGSTAALHFLIDIFGTVAYGYPGYLYDIHSGFNGKAIGFQAWNIEDLASQILSDKDRFGIKAAIINVPHNPLGYNLTESSVKILQELSQEVKLIFDNVYGQYDKRSMELLSQIPNKKVGRSFSKEFGMPGIRLAYIIFDSPSERRMIQTSSSAQYVSIANNVLMLAKWALQFNKEYGLSQHIVENMNNRQSEFERAINSKIKRFGIVPGDIEGMYRILYLDSKKAAKNPEVYNSRNLVGLCKEEGVIVTPLEIFAPPYAQGNLDKTGIRIAVSGSPRTYEGGQRILKAAENMHRLA
ncbi:MAG: pyridoxal phosphate-dependent aminotransferase [Nanoarchaeota archaeon]|nr:pyridoxal phosphate-dependent aminotransferase [Nanoarchaeota archaeon]